jgi:hypothetical protein
MSIIKYDFTVNVGADNTHIEVLPFEIEELYTLGGSFKLKNTGTEADDYSVGVFATSDPTAGINSASWKRVNQISMHPLAAGATSFQEFRKPDEMFYLGHTRLMVFVETADQPCELTVNLVLKKA